MQVEFPISLCRHMSQSTTVCNVFNFIKWGVLKQTFLFLVSLSICNPKVTFICKPSHSTVSYKSDKVNIFFGRNVSIPSIVIYKRKRKGRTTLDELCKYLYVLLETHVLCVPSLTTRLLNSLQNIIVCTYQIVHSI